MPQPRIQFDLTRSQNRTSQRTNEASLVVGRGGDDSSSGMRPAVIYGSTGTSGPSGHSSVTATPKKSVDIPEAISTNAISPVMLPSSVEGPTAAQMTVKFHEDRTSSQNVVLDISSIPGAVEDQVGEIRSLDGSNRRFYFLFQPMQSNLNLSVPQGVVSIKSGPIAKLMDLKMRSPVVVQPRKAKDVEADVVEIYIKDIHLSRGDMWNLTSKLVKTCVYRTQKLGFLNGSIRGEVHRIYRHGHKVFSAYVGEHTKVVFRSESARLLVFIQISAEMWHFEESGQQMFYKLVNSLFPKIFKRWKELGTHHLITIVLFTSVDLDEERQMKYAAGERPPNKEDYYRVVIDQVSILLWNEIMATLRLEFANFKRDILLRRSSATGNTDNPNYTIGGNILPAVKGSLLEAINLGMSLVTNDFQDPDLRVTTNHFIIVSPGTGLFDVDYGMLSQTGNLLATVDSTIDVICLAQPPLHIVPLFRYLDNQHKPHHCIPNFMDISFWSDSGQSVYQWLPRCKIYELQMMGVMENELTSVSINELNLSHYRSALDAMDDYDNAAFRSPLEQRRRASQKKRTAEARHAKKLLSNYARIASATTSTTALPPAPHLVAHRNTNDDNKEFTIEERKGYQPKELVSKKASTPATSTVTGVTTTAKSNVSAFSSLLSISKTSSGRTSNALNFMKRMISGPFSPKIAPIPEESRRTSIVSLSLDDSQPLPSVTEPIAPATTKPQPIRKASTDSFAVSVTNSRNTSIAAHSTGMRRTSTQNSLPQLTRKSTRSTWNDHWIMVENPSKVNSSEMRNLVSYGRWQFVFPPNVRRRIIKWTSLASPAALPIMTPLFPTVEDFNQNFTFRIYDVLLSQEGVNESRTAESLMRSMISLRLTLGFQICIGDKVNKVEDRRKPNGDSKLLVEYLDKDNYEGSRMYLSRSSEIHRVSCDYNGLVNVQVYRRINRSDDMQLNRPKDYDDRIRTHYSDEYKAITIHPSEGENRDYNWNQLDQVLAGYSDSIDAKRYHRMKFVVMPTDVPENSFKLASENLTPEEIRLEGIRSLVATVNKSKWRTSDEKKTRRKKTEITPEISFYTGSLFKYLDHASKEFAVEDMHNSQLFSSPKYDKTMWLSKLAAAMQGPDGIDISDRNWHMSTHKNCFLGTTFVSWLIENFEDIDDRDEAVSYGNQLMDRGLFHHVNGKHRFLDGHYFYQLNKEYVVTRRSNSLVSGSEASKSPMTPLSPLSKAPSDPRRVVSDTLSPSSSAAHPTDTTESEASVGTMSASDIPQGKRKVVLSRRVMYDLDPNGYSWQSEIMQVHYDIVHNPDHCFHIRLEWLGATSKLIEDSVNSWEKHCERYGLALVETPWQELCTLPLRNPLHSTVDISLVLNPWNDPEFGCHTDILEENKYFYHLFLLEKCDFMLDNRTANFFNDDRFDVTYSWGRPSFKYAQFIHTTGAYIAELRENGDFFLAPNNAHIARVNLSIGQLTGVRKGAVYLDSQGVMMDFRRICKDGAKLRSIFREALNEFEEIPDGNNPLFEGESADADVPVQEDAEKEVPRATEAPQKAEATPTVRTTTSGQTTKSTRSSKSTQSTGKD